MVVGHRNGSGFLLLKETIEFLNAENKIHFVVLSSFKFVPQNSVIAYTSPGIAGGFLSNEIFRLKILSSWDAFSKKFCFPDVIIESYFLSRSMLSGQNFPLNNQHFIPSEVVKDMAILISPDLNFVPNR